jgi:CheY-like chemotaxis protein
LHANIAQLISQPGRVLIADDDEAIRNLVSKVLTLAEVPHDGVREGRSAIEALQQQDYEVVLVDLMMPLMDGFELLQYLATAPKRPRTILVMTALPDSDLRDLDAKVVTGIIRKPFDIHELSMVVREAAMRERTIDQRDAATSDGDRLSASTP